MASKNTSVVRKSPSQSYGWSEPVYRFCFMLLGPTDSLSITQLRRLICIMDPLKMAWKNPSVVRKSPSQSYGWSEPVYNFCLMLLGPTDDQKMWPRNWRPTGRRRRWKIHMRLRYWRCIFFYFILFMLNKAFTNLVYSSQSDMQKPASCRKMNATMSGPYFSCQ